MLPRWDGRTTSEQGNAEFRNLLPIYECIYVEICVEIYVKIYVEICVEIYVEIYV